MMQWNAARFVCGGALAALACARSGGGARGDTPPAPHAHGAPSAVADTRPALGMAGGVASTAGAGPRGARMVPLGEMTGNVELLFGHPDSAGLFVMRIAELAGSVIPPHSHPSDDHITVLQGTFYFAVGERYDSTALRELKAGSYAFVPAGATMFGHTPEGAVVQVHAIGPFSIQWRDSTKMLGEPGAAAVFRFRKGDQVSTP